MKKSLLIICLFTFWTSYSIAIDTINLNLIVNSELVESNFSTIKYENYILVPLENFLNKINLQYNIVNSNEEKINIEFANNKLELYLNSCNAYINEQKVNIIVPTITQNNQIYVSMNLINDLTKFHIQYDEVSNSIFVTSESDFKKLNFFFNKVENILKTFNSINIDIINEITSSDGSSYSIGNNIYIDRILNKIFQKNMLDNTWKESDIQISSAINTDFNQTFFAGMSADRLNSNNDYIIFKGYYPLDNNRICYSNLYVNPHTLEIEKQISSFDFEGSTVKQTIFYSFNQKK